MKQLLILITVLSFTASPLNALKHCTCLGSKWDAVIEQKKEEEELKKKQEEVQKKLAQEKLVAEQQEQPALAQEKVTQEQAAPATTPYATTPNKAEPVKKEVEKKEAEKKTEQRTTQKNEEKKSSPQPGPVAEQQSKLPQLIEKIIPLLALVPAQSQDTTQEKKREEKTGTAPQLHAPTIAEERATSAPNISGHNVTAKGTEHEKRREEKISAPQPHTSTFEERVTPARETSGHSTATPEEEQEFLDQDDDNAQPESVIKKIKRAVQSPINYLGKNKKTAAVVSAVGATGLMAVLRLVSWLKKARGLSAAIPTPDFTPTPDTTPSAPTPDAAPVEPAQTPEADATPLPSENPTPVSPEVGAETVTPPSAPVSPEVAPAPHPTVEPVQTSGPELTAMPSENPAQVSAATAEQTVAPPTPDVAPPPAPAPQMSSKQPEEEEDEDAKWEKIREDLNHNEEKLNAEKKTGGAADLTALAEENARLKQQLEKVLNDLNNAEKSVSAMMDEKNQLTRAFKKAQADLMNAEETADGKNAEKIKALQERYDQELLAAQQKIKDAEDEKLGVLDLVHELQNSKKSQPVVNQTPSSQDAKILEKTLDEKESELNKTKTLLKQAKAELDRTNRERQESRRWHVGQEEDLFRRLQQKTQQQPTATSSEPILEADTSKDALLRENEALRKELDAAHKLGIR